MTCQYADLFFACTSRATVAVRWRRWGWQCLCDRHYEQLTSDEPVDLVEVSAA